MRFNGNGYYNGGSNSQNASCALASSPSYNAEDITSGAELALWIWQQYEDTGSLSFLQTYYPLMEQASEFLLAYQKLGSDGYLHAVANAHETQWAVEDPTTDLAADQALFPATVSAAITTPPPSETGAPTAESPSSSSSTSVIAGGVYFFGWTACLRAAPAENFGAFDALIFTRSPVRGLTPWRAARLTTENLPKPVMITSSPFFSVFDTVPRNDSSTIAESAFVRPVSAATASISSDLFILLPFL